MSDLLERVAEYADQLAQAATLADQDSLTHAADMANLYESRSWVEEWLTQAPIRERTAYIGGRPPEPDSRRRFGQWLAWKLEATGHHKIVSQHTYRLLNAHTVAEVISPRGNNLPTSEYVVRPLDWLRKHKYERFIPDVWDRAVELADGGTVTSTHTAAALAEWKRAHRGQVLVSIQSSKVERDRLKARTAVEVLISHGDSGELLKFYTWVTKRLEDATTALGVTWDE